MPATAKQNGTQNGKAAKPRRIVESLKLAQVHRNVVSYAPVLEDSAISGVVYVRKDRLPSPYPKHYALYLR